MPGRNSRNAAVPGYRGGSFSSSSLVLAYLHKGETFAALAPGFGIGTATAWRYVREAVTLLAARAPKLRDALRAAAKAGHAFVVIDSTLIPIDRVAADRPFYSGKHRVSCASESDTYIPVA